MDEEFKESQQKLINRINQKNEKYIMSKLSSQSKKGI